MIFFDIIKIIAVFLSMLGAYLVAFNDKKKRLIGFSIWIISNIIWIIDSLSTANYIQTYLWIFYLGVCIFGIFNLKK